MLGFARKSRGPSWPAMRAPGQQAGSAHDGYAVGLYRQALLTLGDVSLAEHVVLTVIVDECIQHGPPDADARAAARRLAISTYWRCQELGRNRGQRSRSGARLVPAGTPGDTDPAALSVQERGIIGLMLFGGLGYAEASSELAIPPDDLAVIVRAALRRLAVPAAASPGLAGA
jgi:hypothetical protein